MFGISTSVFNEAGGLVKDWLKNPLNASFLYWYFLPSVGVVLLHLFLIGPALGYRSPAVFSVEVGPAKSPAGLILQLLNGSVLLLVLLPLIIGIVLSSLSGTILRLQQGTLPLAHWLFQPWLKRNQKLSRERYGLLEAKRREYLFLVSQGIRLVSVDGAERGVPVSESEVSELASQLKAEIQALHERLEQISSERKLPVAVGRVGPNDLANTLAVAEEYPFERYSMDTAVFWPRLCGEIEPEKLDPLTTRFGAMNGLLNISFLSYLLTIEFLIVGFCVKQGIKTTGPPLLQVRWLIAAALVSLLVGLGTYRAAVREAYSVGSALRTAFDYYRGSILHRFNLKMPDDIEQERVVWLKLAAFIRRGESFYYPSEFRRDKEEQQPKV